MTDANTAPSLPYAMPVMPAVASQDLSHLKILSILHWVFGGLTLLLACVPIIHIVIGVAMLNGSLPMTQTTTTQTMVTTPNGFVTVGGPPQTVQFQEAETFAGWLFVIMGSVFVVIGWTFGLLIAAITCLWFPIGTTLGVFTLIVLMRDSVKQLYDEQSPPALR
jgi:hypothetical protein